MTAITKDMEIWHSWIGKSETQEDRIEPLRAQAMQLVVDDPGDQLREGDALPPLWHWLYFWLMTPQGGLAKDGHAHMGGLLPPIPYGHRMWAGSRFAFRRPLVIGVEATRTSTLTNITEKQGRSGRLVFLTLTHQISDSGGVCIEEEQDIVYREGTQTGAATGGEPAPPVVPWRKEITPDPVLLFRYSALTWNGHKIHYDLAYAKEVEKYPGLVVHGPLLATLMIGLAQEKNPGKTARVFSFRALRPIFDTAPFTVAGKGNPQGDGAEVWIADENGHLAARGTVEFA